MIIIRTAQIADIPAMVDLLAELFTLEKDFAVNTEKQWRGLTQLLGTASAAVWVAEKRSNLQIVGLCTVQTLISTAEGGKVGLIEDLIVAHACRRQGIAQQLVQQTITWARQQDLQRLQLLADKENQPALSFYAAQGWQPTQLIALRFGLTV